MFLSDVAHEVQPSMFVLYTDYRYGWDARTVGFVVSALGVMSALVGGGLVPVAVRRLGERRCLLFGLAVAAGGFVVYGLAPTGMVFCAGMPIVCLWALAGPAAQALMTRRVEASEQGRLQGAIAGLRGLAFMIGPGIFTGTFAAAVSRGHAPGVPFLVA